MPADLSAGIPIYMQLIALKTSRTDMKVIAGLIINKKILFKSVKPFLLLQYALQGRSDIPTAPFLTRADLQAPIFCQKAPAV